MSDVAPYPDGWVSLLPGWAGAEGLHVRIRMRDGRLVITEMYLHADDEVTSETLRGLSVSRLEATMNARLQRPGGELFAASMTSNSADVPEPSLAELRRRVPGAAAADPPERPRLTRPGGKAPEEFYPRVAAAYHEYAPQTRAPAKEIAAEAGVPVTTAHRWIREARRRGFLSPARKGRAG